MTRKLAVALAAVFYILAVVRGSYFTTVGLVVGAAAAILIIYRYRDRIRWDQVGVVAPIILILALALVIRLWGIDAGLPELSNDNEILIAGKAYDMLGAGEYNPHFFHYPSGIFYLMEGVLGATLLQLAKAGETRFLSEVPRELLVFHGRQVIAFMGVLLLLPIYFLARSYASKRAALFALAGAAFMPLLVGQSRQITPNLPTAFGAAVALWLIFKIVTKGKLANYVAAGAGVGLAIGFKYNAATLAIPLLAAHLANRERRTLFDGRLLAALLAVVVVFLITTPYAILAPDEFLAGLAYPLLRYSAGHPGFTTDFANWEFARDLFTGGATPLVTLVALWGIGVAFVRARREDIVMLLYPLMTFAGLASLKIAFIHNLLPILPSLAVFAGAGADSLLGKIENRAGWGPVKSKGITAVAVLLLACWPLVLSAEQGYSLSKPDTREVAADWIKKNVKPNSVIAKEEYTPALHDFPRDERKIFGLFMAEYQAWMDQGVEYFIASSYMYGRYRGKMDRYAGELERYQILFNRCKLLKEFPGSKWGTPGPTIKVYRAPKITERFDGFDSNGKAGHPYVGFDLARDSDLCLRGWDQLETATDGRTFVWANETESVLKFWPVQSGQRLLIGARGLPGPEGQPQRMEVVLDNVSLGDVELARNWGKVYRFDIPDISTTEEPQLVFRFRHRVTPNSINPRLEGGRMLSAAIDFVNVADLGDDEGAVVAPGTWTNGRTGDAGVVAVRPPGKVSFNVSIPEDGFLTVKPVLTGDIAEKTLNCRIQFQPGTGTAKAGSGENSSGLVTLWDEQLPREEPESLWLYKVDLEEVQGLHGTLVFEVDGRIEGDSGKPFWFAFSDLTLSY